MQPKIEKHENQNQGLESMGLAEPDKMGGLTASGPGLACQQAAGWVFRWVSNQTRLISTFKSGLVVCYPDQLLSRSISEPANTTGMNFEKL